MKALLRRALIACYFLFIATVLGASCFLAIFPSDTIAWTGGYPVTVHVHSRAGKPIRSVRCEAFRHQESAELATDINTKNHLCEWNQPPRDVKGAPLTVFVQMEGRDSSYFFSGRAAVTTPFIGVLVEYQDGQEYGDMRMSPDKEKKEVTFQVP